MPVAISFPDAVNSAAPFSNVAVRGDSASGVASLAVKEGNSCETCLAPKKGSQKDQDFDAVLALLISGGNRLQQTTVVQTTTVPQSEVTTTANTVSASADLGSNAAGTANSVKFGQTTIHPANSPPQVTPASQTATQMASKLSGEIAIPDTFGTNTDVTNKVDGVDRTQQAAEIEISAEGTPNETVSSVAIDAKYGSITAKASQSARVNTAQQIADDLESVPTQSQSTSSATPPPSRQSLATSGTVLATPATSHDAQATAVHVSASTQSSDPSTATPLSLDMINALERIGRPPAVTGPIVSAVQMTKPTTAAAVSSEPPASRTDSSAITTPAGIIADSNVRTETIPGAMERAAMPESTATTSPVTLPTLPTGTVPAVPIVASTKEKITTAKSPTSVSQGSTTLVSTPAESPVPVSALTTSDSMPMKPSVPSLKSAPSAATHTSDPASALGRLEPLARTIKPRVSSHADSQMSDFLTSQTSSTEQFAATQTSPSVMSGAELSSVANTLPSLAAAVPSEMRQPLTSQVSQAIMDHIERNGVHQSDSLSVRLDPPELGEMTIELSKTQEGLAIRVTAREAVTMDMLLVRGQEIESQLRGRHMNLKSLEFMKGDMSGNGFSQGQQQSDPSRRSENMANQARRSSRSLSPANASAGRTGNSDSTYGLSFRA